MVEKKTRASHTVMPYSMDKEYVDAISIPIHSYGECACGIVGDLGDGLCQGCWDKKWSVRISSQQRAKRRNAR